MRTPIDSLSIIGGVITTHLQSTLLANGSLFVYGSTPSQITLNTDPLTKSDRDLSVKAQFLPHKAGQYALKINNIQCSSVFHFYHSL